MIRKSEFLGGSHARNAPRRIASSTTSPISWKLKSNMAWMPDTSRPPAAPAAAHFRPSSIPRKPRKVRKTGISRTSRKRTNPTAPKPVSTSRNSLCAVVAYFPYLANAPSTGDWVANQ